MEILLLKNQKKARKDVGLKACSIISFLLLLGLTICHYLFFNNSYALPDTEIASLFQQWMIEYHKNYSSQSETFLRYKAFRDNYNNIISWNANQSKTATLEINKFADLTQEEFGNMWCGYNPQPNENPNFVELNDQGIPDSYDWSSENAVTPVKNQLGCNSSWAFAVVGALETLNFIELDYLMAFSEQQIIDCMQPTPASCSTGDVVKGFEYVKQYGIAPESQYPYKGTIGLCIYSDQMIEFRFNKLNQVAANNVEQLQIAVSQQPVAAGIQANQLVFQFYKEGVIGSECGNQLNHAILIVGYGQESNTNKGYWKVKNSWGSDWGLDGYALIEKNTTNACGILSTISYPAL